MKGAEPEPVVGQLGELVCHDTVEPESVLGEGQTLEGTVGSMDDCGGGRLVDFAALDTDEAVLNVVDPADAVGTGEVVDLLDQNHRI